ncbi:MAG: DNA polymerase III subunit alpha [Acidobacteria bacterium]|nr:DNA polymerase III subunit alpha [Acidobacteriota bacterium]
MPSNRNFVHLHLHTDYSLLKGAIQLRPLVSSLKTLEMEACAITDYANMFGAISFYKTMKDNGIKPILGYEAMVTFSDMTEKNAAVNIGERPYYHLVLLAKDYSGYLNLCHLASKAYTDGFHHRPRIDLDLLREKSEGLIGLSSGIKGPIGHFIFNDNPGRAVENTNLFKDIFGEDNFFLEIQDHDLSYDQKIREGLREVSKRTGVALVATNDAHYLTREDSKANDILLCIGEGKTINDPTRSTLGSDQYYLRSAEEMWEVLGDEFPDALNRTVEIAERCNVEIPLENNLLLPGYPIPEDSGCKTTEEYFREVVYEGFETRKTRVLEVLKERGELKNSLDEYEKRLEIELETIRNMGFPGYFLIVWDFIRYAREKDIPVGPGRGSAAGSLVAYCLEITDIDPIQYDLLFERFLNPERISMPDIDIDFCVNGRAEVIEHVSEFYGRDSVCQIITFGTMASKAAIKDVGRALSMPYADVEKIAKLIPPPVRGRNVSIEQALEQVPELRQAMAEDPLVKELVDLARRLEGCARHTSVHAAGVVISPKPLHELVPVAVSSRNEELTSQYPMNDLEKVGMLKMDFLALTTLTIINNCLKTIKEKRGEVLNWSEVSLKDEKAMDLFGRGLTDAIFQFESGGMQEICRRLKPKELEDLAALNALYRPGPLDGGMVDDFIARHRGEKPVRYIVPEMEEILKNTYGILVYQEQIMQLAQKLGGYSLGEADMMRRAMGKKKRSEMAIHEEKFVNGAVENGVNRKKAEEIFGLMSQFADYGFNRSHSVAYAYVAYQTAYLKAHYAAYFYASVLSSEADDSSKIYKYASELRNSGLSLLPPDVNESDLGFTPLEDAIRFGLTAIKGIGTATVEAIIEARDKGGRFTSLFDFTSRLDQGVINRRGLESLVGAGAFDSIAQEGEDVSVSRARFFAGIDLAISHAQKTWEDKLRGQTDLFAEMQTTEALADDQLPDAEPWSQKELSAHEKASIGFYLSTHPLETYKDTIEDLGIVGIAEYAEVAPGERITIAGMVSRYQAKYSKKGNRFCIFRLEDQLAGVKCLGWAEMYNKYGEVLADDELLIVEGRVEANEGQEITLIVDEVKRLSDSVFESSSKLSIDLPRKGCDENLLGDILSLLSKKRGRCDVYLRVPLENGVVVDVLAEPLKIEGTSGIEAKLKQLGCSVVWS